MSDVLGKIYTNYAIKLYESELNRIGVYEAKTKGD